MDNWNSELMMALDGNLQDQEVTAVYTERDINVRNKFGGNPSNSCQDISLWTKNVNLMVVLEKKWKDYQSH